MNPAIKLPPQAVSDALLCRQIPALKNSRYLAVYKSGRERCLAQALAGGDVRQVPLYSHNQTYQSLFSSGWASVNAQDIRLASVGASHVRHA